MKDAGEAVAELTQGSVVSDGAVPECVVVRAGSRWSAQGAECLRVQGIGHALVTHVSGHHTREVPSSRESAESVKHVDRMSADVGASPDCRASCASQAGYDRQD